MSIDAAVKTVLVDCLGVKAGEVVLVVVDPHPERRRIGMALTAGARELGAETVFAEMSERESHGAEPPAPIAAAMLESKVFIAPTTKSLSHTSARRKANERGVRGATMPQITEEMLIRTMTADYSEVKRRSKALAEVLTSGSQVRITSERGTDVTIGIEGREGLSDDGDLWAPGSFGNLPAGEGFIAPVEGTTNGVIVFDGSAVPFSEVLDEPITVEVRDGFAERFSGSRGAEWRAHMEPYGRDAFNVAELGIGTNEKATLTGNILEDEKIIGTIHIALGDNHTIGGTVEVASHLDALVGSPTVSIDGRKVLEGGHLLV
jgi:leucyl aminopeptidase (aminopeptidase T)